VTTADLVNENREQAREQQPPGWNNGESGHAPLFDEHEAADLRGRWQQIQGSFVDEPRAAVEKADELVAAAIKRLAEIFADERGKMENEWSRGDEVSTEDLRQALRRYRSFFDGLLTV
jgi:hypothetical protein